jgi:ribonuclease P/MRP protein subunit POP7
MSKISKKIIKHAPLRPYVHTELDSTIYVKSTTPFISAVKRIEKMINKFDEIPNKRGKLVRRGNINKDINYILVKGMGKSINKVLNIGLHFKYEEKFNVDIFTKSVGVLDEIVEDDNDNDDNDNDGDGDIDDHDDLCSLKKRNVGAIEVKIYI